MVNSTCIRDIEHEIEKIHVLEEVYWHQRARVHWLMAGDKNTKFFHARATCRQKCNRVDRLMNAHGDLCSDDRENIYHVAMFQGSIPDFEPFII